MPLPTADSVNPVEPISYQNDNLISTTAIQQTTITETKSVKYFKVHVLGLELFKSVTVSVTLMDENGLPVGHRSYIVADEEYLAWNNNDQYLVDLVAQKLGFTLA